MKANISYGSLAAIVLAATVGSQSAWAQDAQGADATDEGIETIIVTARKTAESQQDVPVAITAFSQEGLERQNVLNVQDLQTAVPGLFVAPNSQGGAPTFAIRAAKADNGTSQTVTTYINDMPTTTTMAVANMVYDMQSVSTLKGPQGTLFGANSTGGAIIFRPNQPSDHFEGYVEGGIGNYSRRYLEGMVNIPVGDVLALRLAGNLVRRDGFIKNVATPAERGLASKEFRDEHRESLRFSAKLTPSDRIENQLMVSYFNMDQSAQQAIAVFLRPRYEYTTFLNGLKVPVDYAKAGISASPDYKHVRVGPEPTYQKARIWDVTNTTSLELNDNLTAKLALGYEHASLDEFANNGATVARAVNVRTKDVLKQFTIEPSFDFNGVDGRLRVKVGGFYSDMKRATGNGAEVIGLPFDPPGPLAAVIPNFYPLASLANYWRHLKSKAVYSQWSFDITDSLTATLGGRYTWDTGKYTAANKTALGLANVLKYAPRGVFADDVPEVPCGAGVATYKNPDLVKCRGHQDYKTSSPSFTAVLEKKFGPGVMAYATARTGYLVGGFNNQVFVAGNFGQVFKPEKVMDAEVGIKADWDLAGQPVRTNFDIFAGKYKNQQRVQNGTTSQGTTFIAVQNAGKSHFYGADLEIMYDVTDTLQLGANYQYIKAEYDSFFAPLNIPGVNKAFVNYKGKAMSQTPSHTLNLSGTYKVPLPDEYGKLSATLSYFYRSKTAGHDAPTVLGTVGPTGELETITEDFTAYDMLPSYSLVNLSVNWDRFMGTDFDVRFWVKNLLDKKYTVYQSNQLLQFGYATYQFGNPQELGVNVRYAF